MQSYELIRSGRRTLALEVRGGRVIVRAPYRASQAVIDRFVAAHADWITHALDISCESIHREAGANPARSRHCNRDSQAIDH